MASSAALPAIAMSALFLASYSSLEVLELLHITKNTSLIPDTMIKNKVQILPDNIKLLVYI